MIGGGDNGGGGGGLAGLVQAVFAHIQPVLVQGMVQNLQGLQPNIFGPNGLMQQHIEQLQAQHNPAPEQPPPAHDNANLVVNPIPPGPEPAPEIAPDAGAALPGDDLVPAPAGAPHGDPAPGHFQPGVAAAAAAPDEVALGNPMDELAAGDGGEEAEDMPELVYSSEELSEEEGLEFPWPDPQGDEMEVEPTRAYMFKCSTYC